MGFFDFLKGKNKQDQPGNDYLLQKVEFAPGLSLARAFEHHRDAILQTKIPSIHIKATPDNDLALEQSKFGHYPCMPLHADYPKDERGRYMYPLAQLNFKEMPSLPGFPTSGYLQFYISVYDEAYGLDFNYSGVQKNFRVLFFEEDEVLHYKADFSFLDEVMSAADLPVQSPHLLGFTLTDEYVGMGDIRYENGPVNLSLMAAQYPDIENELEESLHEELRFGGHKTGGYAFFTQMDPRENEKGTAEYIVLLQIDTDDQIMWGDSGVAHFFIHPTDLAKKDFSKVMYNWDCY
ncbi:MAG: DUF1963 domain-containing protein [Bacteroidetes bacterium]|nr:DUF1963 domain-containing protein [Bacteroidota bacterium]